MMDRTPQELWAAMPDWARRIVDEVAAEAKVPRADILGESRFRAHVEPRHEVWRRACAARPGISSKRLEMTFGHDSSTIRHALRKLAGIKRPRNPSPDASRAAAE